MQKCYCKVRFSFGVYTFHTFVNSYIKGEYVLCLVKNNPLVGEFVEYCEKPKFDTKPCYGGIGPIINNHSDMEEQYMKQHEKYCPALEYYHGAEVIHNGAIWRMEKDKCWHFVRPV